ncbi:MAG: class II aldolase/adducin family protein, partial [Thermomicrobiales bacterium]
HLVERVRGTILTRPLSARLDKGEHSAYFHLPVAPRRGIALVEMHSKVYEKRPDIGAIIHTHSPYATAFAIANKPLPCVYEAMARFDMHDGIPVAPYAPRGSKESVANILGVIGEKTRCVLLQNHGILAFGETIETATMMALILEEAAHMAILAESLGGVTVIPEDQAFYALQRTRQYADMLVTPADGE